ncbi:unnamed protein product [Blepharisma stoltei]|uniref:Membrane-bound O-acyltransferase C24H6.01c n=1 Tax=Blepharisma stoltei TaxID=1481888 RepID=A0AAU9IM69_9CILI|nr:unnamed protein product [Blepharisma stoltei]
MLVSPAAKDSPTVNFLRKAEIGITVTFLTWIIYTIFSEAWILSSRVAASTTIDGLEKSSISSSGYVDLNDGQLATFLSNLPALLVFATLFVSGRKLLISQKLELKHQLIYYLFIGIGMNIYLHGPGFLFLLFELLFNYLLAYKYAGKRGFPLLAWAFNFTYLILAEYYHGFQFSWFAPSLKFLDDLPVEMNWSGVNKMCMLKALSFVLDYHWALSKDDYMPLNKHKLDCNECNEINVCFTYRMRAHASHYSLLAYAAYFFYPPLYFAGPTVCYNAWISQVQSPQRSYDTKKLIIYGLRIVVVFIILELFIHNLYFPAIAGNDKNTWIWESFTPFELVIASYVILKWIWLKFTLIWRFFRMWALCDGIETPENMGRCMSNNYCFEGFWRMWHRAFNQWLIRYLFVPLGGSKYKIFNIWIVFGFVALWHDLNLNLLVWGWGMCLFIMPEVLVKSYFQRSKFLNFRKTLKYSWLCAFGGGIYIILMMAANLVGFSFGVRGLIIVLEEIFTLSGSILLFKVILTATMATHFMLIVRHQETRCEIKNKGF